MLIKPLPGASRDNLLRELTEVHTAVSNLYTGGPHTAQERLLAYLDWTANATQRLGWQISNDDLNRLVLTRRYEHLLAGVGTLGLTKETERLTNNLVSLELRQRVTEFEQTLSALRDRIGKWSRPRAFVVFDTTVFIEHETKLEKMDFLAAAGLPPQPVHLVVPMVVVDELDRLKESRDRDVRWRAGYSLAVLDNRLPNPNAIGVLRGESVPLPGQGADVTYEITVEILLDSPGHVRLTDEDDEIVDRALAVESLAGRKVLLLTYDTGQSTRARAAGLQVKKLTKPLGEEPKA